MYRAETCNLLRLGNGGNIIIDSGEGGYAQLCRMYTEEQVDEILRKTRVFFISHKHPDHMRGLLVLLHHRRRAFQLEKLSDSSISPDLQWKCQKCHMSFNYAMSLEKHNLIHNQAFLQKYWEYHVDQSKGTNSVALTQDEISMLNDMSNVKEDIPTLPTDPRKPIIVGAVWILQFLIDSGHFQPCDFHFLDCSLLQDPNSTKNPHLAHWFQENIGIKIQCVQVIHSYPAYGIVITTPTFKFVYSGDTRPSANLIEAGKGATVVLHEANFQDEMSHKAITDRHSTVTEAMNVGSKMEAEVTVLTHFSARVNSGVPSLGREWNQDRSVGLAFDFQRIRIPQDIHRLTTYTHIFQQMYPSDDSRFEAEA
eukprot:TRINITY_DN7316_c0_g1_i5.p1 TRINITY_DN7316_c0_g1~~TRINITY_DN7316_c0_g1_i5.p1  ORF type:complete len:366 (+),score=117.05 TRINITY_DN7316_c0_g1_i5:604-1701(+)